MADDDPMSTLAGWRKIEQAATPGPWQLEWDSCDCGDGYGCSHGSWPRAIRTSRAHTGWPDGVPRDYDFAHTEISELGDSDAEFIATARTAMPLLVAAVEKVLEPHRPGRITIFGHLCKHHRAHRDFSITAREADGVRACPDCKATVYASCAGCGPQVSADECPTRKAITEALAKAAGGTALPAEGEGAGDG